MQSERYIVILLLLPLVFWIIAAGGWFFIIAIMLVLGLAASELATLFRKQGFRPAGPLIVSGVAMIALAQVWDDGPRQIIIPALILLVLSWHLVDYQRGTENSGTDLMVSLGGLLYVGIIGSYMISLRMLPDGEWWFLTILPAVWMADAFAYMFGRRYGKHSMASRLSPKKTWEGYIAGIVGGVLGGALFAALWRISASPESAINPMNGMILGAIVAIVTPLGDLAVSMVKRQFNEKDSGQLLPGHGGVLDRIDTWIWGAAIGYFYVTLLI